MRGRGVRWDTLVHRAAPLAALVLVAALLHAGAAHARSDPTTYEGSVTEFYGAPVPAQAIDASGQGVGVNRLNFVLEDLPSSQVATISGDLRFELQGVALDEQNRSIGLVCFRFELTLDGYSIPITGASADTFSYRASVDVNVFSSDAACARGGGELTPEKADFEFTKDFETDRLSGSLTIGADSLKFEMTPVADTGFTTFLEGTSVSLDLLKEAQAASACPASLVDSGQPFSELPDACQVPRNIAIKFAADFAKDFKDPTILKDLTAVIMLRSMVNPDGKRLLPTLNRLLKPIALLAIKADSEGDAAALTAMNRLIGFPVTGSEI